MVLPWSVSIHPFEQEVHILIPRMDFKSLFNFCPFCGSVLMETGGGGGGVKWAHYWPQVRQFEYYQHKIRTFAFLKYHTCVLADNYDEQFTVLLAKHLCVLFIKMPNYFVVSEVIHTCTIPSPQNEFCGSSKRLKFHCSQQLDPLLPQEFPIPSVRGRGRICLLTFLSLN